MTDASTNLRLDTQTEEIRFDIANPCFSLKESFLKKYRGKQPDWGPIGYIVSKRTYARTLPDGKSSEEWWQTLKRVTEGTFSIQKNHCRRNHLTWDEHKAQRSAEKMFHMMWEFKWLPPGRGLWAMGTEHVQKAGGTALNNCGFISTRSIDKDLAHPFMFLMDMSMLGVGIGFDTRGAGKCKIVAPVLDARYTYAVPDSREGWVTALKLLLDAYSTEGLSVPKYDFSLVRAAGEPIHGFGGVASGPEPLREMLTDIEDILDQAIGTSLTSEDIVDIANLIGRCVVAGNVRRTAEIAFGDPNDDVFTTLKQNQEKLDHHRWASNNSIFAEVGMDYSSHAASTVINGEPGYMWLENARKYGRMIDQPNYKDEDALGGNPCLEQTLHDYELCTLVETFPARHSSVEEYMTTLKLAYLYAKTVTLVPTHWGPTNTVIAKNRRIGLSQSGIIRNIAKIGFRQHMVWCDSGYRFTKSLDTQYSNWLGVPRSIKITSVKPSGTVSLLCGEPPGIHYPHSEYYIRRVRLSDNSPLLQPLIDAGYETEPEFAKSGVVVNIPVKEKDFKKGQKDASIWEQVGNAAAMQSYWADNQVSCTVTFREEEAGDVAAVLERFEDKLKGISFFPPEHGYKQPPYEEIDKETYERMSSVLKPIVFDVNVETDSEAPKFCDSDHCEI